MTCTSGDETDVGDADNQSDWQKCCFCKKRFVIKYKGGRIFAFLLSPLNEARISPTEII